MTTPVTRSTVYVPSPGTVRDFFVQLGGVSVSSTPVVNGLSRPHNFTVVATRGALEAPAVSFVKRLIT